ncbi:MAG: ROK family protein [Nanoarchaeota archaeon]|nr:ROK family protein [Nanoarchaeota archaeon]MBU1030839.1 ROK family protein [Nanoarchaeota archaeon]MBU1850252.1 ROK family protein [Nanoarchaeota archaeon]
MKYAIGLDIGGTKIEGVLCNEKYQVKKRIRIKTPEKKVEFLKALKKIIGELKIMPVEGVGISIGGFLDEKKQLINCPNILFLQKIDIHSIIKKGLGQKIKVVVENDANCFAIAEHKLGAGKGSTNMVGVILGTGIGSGIIINNELYKGSIGAAGEFGHTIIDVSKNEDNKWENFCSGPNIVKRYYVNKGKMKEATPSKIFKSNEFAAKKTVKKTIELLSVGFANINNALNPDKIVVGGGLSNINFYKELNKETKKRTIPLVKDSSLIVKNQLGDSSGVLGAVMLVL